MKALWQFLKYIAVGGASTLVQIAAFYVLSIFVWRCLNANDPVVTHLGVTPADIGDAARTLRAGVNQGIAFVISNVFCWLMNRRFVFVPGRHGVFTEFAMFIGASSVAFFLGVGLQSLAIYRFGVATTYAGLVQILTSVMVNFFARKVFIFKS